MMELQLESEDVALLTRVLSRYMTDLRMEIAGTESFNMRQDLKRDEERLKALLARLEVNAAATGS